MNFRRFFLSLLASEKKREAYLANDFKCDYDAEFMKKLQKLTNTFLDDIRKKMPLTAVEEVINLTKKCGCANFPSLNPFKPEFTIGIFIHYKPRIAVAILDL